MNHRLKVLLSMVLLLAPPVFAQSAQPPAASPEQKRQAEARTSLEVLNNTAGVDLSLYLRTVFQAVKSNWYNLIPAAARAPVMKQGKVSLEFAIMRDGRVRGLKLQSGSGDLSLDRAAWGGITGSNPFPPLPPQFVGTYLIMRFHFFYNDPDFSSSSSDRSSGTSLKSGITIKIFPPAALKVPIGGSGVVTAVVTGSSNSAVKWNVTGAGCSGSTCGSVEGDLYIAPPSLPSPPSVTITASSEADPVASASLTVNLVVAEDSK